MTTEPTQVRLRSRGAPAASDTLVDSFGRVHRDLRVSVTDRCNLRCTYCLPETDVEFLPRAEILSFEEIVRVAGVARGLGVRTVRITGGEPLLRRDLPLLVEQLAGLGFEDLSLTTNAMLLERHAGALAAAGLNRVNVSCDSLRADRFAAIRRRGSLPTVLRGMDAAEAAGLGPVKINVVLVAGVNDDEVEELAAFGRSTGRTIRFIEFMPLDADEAWAPGQVVDSDEVLARISRRWPLVAVPSEDPSAPAERFAFTDGAGEIGVIRTVTKPFCGSCDRLRLTADGSLRNCLFGDGEVSIKSLLRSGADDAAIADALRGIVWTKRAGRGSDDLTLVRPSRSMSMIGG